MSMGTKQLLLILCTNFNMQYVYMNKLVLKVDLAFIFSLEVVWHVYVKEVKSPITF